MESFGRETLSRSQMSGTNPFHVDTPMYQGGWTPKCSLSCSFSELTYGEVKQREHAHGQSYDVSSVHSQKDLRVTELLSQIK